MFRRILLLTTDATSASLVTPEIAPHFSSLIRSGISCSRAYAHGNPTQFSFPTIMTSSLPLDYGGYDQGIRHRPVTLAEALGRGGYTTVGLSSTVWMSSLFGYTRGFDRFYGVHNPVGSWNGSLLLYLRYWKGLLEERHISKEECYHECKLLLGDWFPYLIAHATGDAQAAGEETVGDYRELGWDRHMSGIAGRLQREHEAFSRDPEGYLDSRLGRMAQFELRKVLRFATAAGPANFVPAWRTFRLVLDTLEEFASQSVFFWAHFRDVHDYYNLPQAFDEQQGERTRAMAVTHWDSELGRFLEILRNRGFDKDCLIIVHADHGSGTACSLDEMALRVPLVFWTPDCQRTEISALCSLIDLAPSILDLARLPSESSFQGLPIRLIDPEVSRVHLAEHAGRGPCDLTRKCIQMSCTDGEHFSFFHEPRPGNPLQESTSMGRQNEWVPAIREQFHEFALRRARQVRKDVDNLAHSSLRSDI